MTTPLPHLDAMATITTTRSNGYVFEAMQADDGWCYRVVAGRDGHPVPHGTVSRPQPRSAMQRDLRSFAQRCVFHPDRGFVEPTAEHSYLYGRCHILTRVLCEKHAMTPVEVAAGAQVLHWAARDLAGRIWDATGACAEVDYLKRFLRWPADPHDARPLAQAPFAGRIALLDVSPDRLHESVVGWHPMTADALEDARRFAAGVLGLDCDSNPVTEDDTTPAP